MSIICGDCLEVMKTFPDNHFSAIVTDPPYGLSFMGKGWDHAVPGVDYWGECFRIVRPGSFLLAMGGTRTFHRLTCAIEDAGWEIRDCISWLYGSGFPKSHNHFGIEGYGTALKPAWEPCIVAMKPCDGTFKQNAEKWGQAGINIDGCRVGTDDTRSPTYNMTSKGHRGGAYGSKDVDYSRNGQLAGSEKGRWPANVILDEEAGALLDEQSGILSTGSMKPQVHKKKNEVYGKFKQASPLGQESSSGGASRFFYCAKASSRERNEGLEGFPSIDSGHEYGYGPSEGRNVARGETPKKNNHPTVKPLKLMEYLIKLIMPPKDGLLLDLFAGSGTTILAAKRLGFDAIGIEKSEEYAEIARARVSKSPEYAQDIQLRINSALELQQLDLFAKEC